jgi:hypothetical protein
MKKRLFAILTASILVFGIAGVSVSAAAIPLKQELPNEY